MIYVDVLKPSPRSQNWHNDEVCLLLADPTARGAEQCLEVLHVFAESIGLKRNWLRHTRHGMPHYALSPRRREWAVAQGAHEADRQQAKQIIKAWQDHARSTSRVPSKARGSRAAKPGSHAIQQPTTT